MKRSENVRKGSESVQCPHPHQVICHLSPVTGQEVLARSTPAAEGVSKSVWLTIGKGALKNTNKFDIHFLILASSLCFLSKASFKVQNLFQ